MALSEKEKMTAGEWFDPLDRELSEDRLHAAKLQREINTQLDCGSEAYCLKLRELCPNMEPKSFIRAPFHCDYGYNIYIGEDSFINFNCVMLDLAPIRIGRRVLIASNVQLLTATHPMDSELRATQIEQGKAITIGDDCWLGGGVILCPGVSIGEGSIIGAGSVVTRDVPPYSVAVGNPARVIKSVEKK